MIWSQQYPKAQTPAAADFDRHMESSRWAALRDFIETTYGVSPVIEYSRCGSAPGWNMKYRKGSRSICTLYPDQPEAGQFTCLVVIGKKEADRAEALLPACDSGIQTLYRTAGGAGGSSRWLMIAVTSDRILEDVKALLQLRVKPPEKRGGGS